MAWHCEATAPMSGEIEVDESYFGARRVKGRRGCGAFGKTAVSTFCQNCTYNMQRNCNKQRWHKKQNCCNVQQYKNQVHFVNLFIY